MAGFEPATPWPPVERQGRSRSSAVTRQWCDSDLCPVCTGSVHISARRSPCKNPGSDQSSRLLVVLGKDSHRRATSGLCVGRLSIQAIAQVLYRRSLIWPNSSPAVSVLRSRIGVIQSVPATNLATRSRQGRNVDWPHRCSIAAIGWVGSDISGAVRISRSKRTPLGSCRRAKTTHFPSPRTHVRRRSSWSLTG